jgi:hypothetical protein
VKRISKIYSYVPMVGGESHKVTHQRFGSLVRECGISGEVIREKELDVPGARYYSSPLLAVEGFLVKARARLHELLQTREETDSDVRDWRAAIDIAIMERAILTTPKVRR